MTQVQKICIAITIIYHECSVPLGGGVQSSPRALIISPHMYHDTLIVLNIPQNTQDVPHSTHDIPHGTQNIPHDTEHSHSNENTLYRVLVCHAICFIIWQLSMRKFHHMTVFSEGWVSQKQNLNLKRKHFIN